MEPALAPLFFYSFIVIVSILMFNILLSIIVRARSSLCKRRRALVQAGPFAAQAQFTRFAQVDTFIKVQQDWGDAESLSHLLDRYISVNIRRKLRRSARSARVRALAGNFDGDRERGEAELTKCAAARQLPTSRRRDVTLGDLISPPSTRTASKVPPPCTRKASGA